MNKDATTTESVVFDTTERLTYKNEDYTFKSNMDLSEGVKVSLRSMKTWNLDLQIKAAACFSEYFFIQIYPQLTTFVGMNKVDFNFVPPQRNED